MSSFYAEQPMSAKELRRELAREKKEDDKRHDEERKEMKRKALESVMSLSGCSEEEAKELLKQMSDEFAERLKKGIKEANAKLRRRPASKSVVSQALAKGRISR